jgi:glucokinase
MEQFKDQDRLLVADIGGTHARFSFADASIGASSLTPPFVLETNSFDTFSDALQEVMDETGRPVVRAAAVCAAGPVVAGPKGPQIEMTNCSWVLSDKDLAEKLGTDDVALVNDFAALAHALQLFAPDDLRQIGGGASAPGGPKGVLGAGTGLGVAGLVPDSRNGFALVDGEGGHADISPTNARELAIFERLLQRFGTVSAETILSGDGLEALHDALCELEGRTCEKVSAAEIAARAATGGEPLSAEAVECFTNWLGSAAANVALTLGATGGIYIAGGIVPKWGGLFDGKKFRARFENRGKMEAYMKDIPTYVVTAPDPALKGLVEIANDMVRA